ncbi:MAG: YigZ family protein [Lentisphaeraceae bacterium]|nr:YigZ family protein [Lentisphaeraceae bacterium]
MPKTITQAHEYSEEIKRSRFICLAIPISCAQDAMDFFAEKSIPSASHNCWAYKVGRDYRFNDDGEPAGTAGKRMLAAIEYQDMTNVAVLIIRWFGGIKLGAGGLSRAYGGVASTCLREADIIEIKEMSEISFQLAFEFSSHLHTLLNNSGAQKVSEEYNTIGVVMTLSMESKDCDEFKERLINLSRGSVIFKKNDK